MNLIRIKRFGHFNKYVNYYKKTIPFKTKSHLMNF